MTTYSETYPGNYLESADLAGKEVRVEISEFVPANTEKAADGRVIEKPILRFKGAKRALICNKTNMKRILLFYAKPGVKQLEELVGTTITLGTEMARNPSLNCKMPAVRVMVPREGRS